MLRNCLFLLSAGVLFAACASGGDDGIHRRDDDGGGFDAGPQGVDAGPLDCDPPCVTGEVCRDGVCVSAGSDGDSDGVPSEMDCDDADPAVGSTASRTCSSACGAGASSCTDGVWSECTAPSSCDCTDGEPPRTVACDRCGMQRQICTGGAWTNDGTCTGMGACAPGDMQTGGACGSCGTLVRSCNVDCTWGDYVCMGEGACAAGATETDTQACGACGTGTQTRTHTCQTDCTWGAWSAWGTCSGGTSECTAGQVDSETQACGNCGTRTRTRSCDGCAWGTWSSWSACSGEGVCAPGATRTGCDPCGVEVCSGACRWGACQPAAGNACLYEGGTSYQCCTPSGGGAGWQFCSSATCQWFPCASHSC